MTTHQGGPLRYLTLLLLIACSGSEPTSPTITSRLGGQDARATYLVTFRDHANPHATAQRLASAHGGRVRFVYQHALRGMALELPAQAVEHMRRDRDVARVEPDGVAREVVLWNLDRLNQRTLPLDNASALGDSGAGVTVYVLDTGIRSDHREFTGRMDAGFSAIADSVGTEDCRGHGTHVAGTIAGSTYGVAPKARLVSVRVLNCEGQGAYSEVIAGIEWVTANAKPASVANMSLGGGYSATLNAAVANSIASDVVYSVAAGNSQTDACTQSPASEPTAVTVGASDIADARAYFSNYGSCVDLFAPGVNVISASIASPTGSTTLSGTSMAAPHVAGALALYRGAHPTESPAMVMASVTENATNGVVTDTRGAPNRLLYIGTAPNTPPPAPNALPVAEFSLYYIQGTYRVAVNPLAFDPDGVVNAVTWSWGDGQQSSGLGVMYHTYANPGTYTIRMTARDDDYGSASVTKVAQVTGTAQTTLPTATFTYTCAGLTCTFTGTATAGNAPIAVTRWYFGDGTSADAPTLTHTYPASATYLVRFLVLDVAGAGDLEEKYVAVSVGTTPPPPPPADNPPVAGFTFLCSSGGDLLCEFRSTSTDDFGIVRYRWNFGDGVIVDAGSVVRHDYGAPTTVTATLTVTDGKGQAATASQSINLRKYAKGKR
jgi:PKD repeat protein